MHELKFAETLSALIKEKQAKLGDVSAAVGVSKQSISDYCLGNITPKYPVLLKLADYFGVTLEYLLTGLDTSNEIEHKDLGLSGRAIRLLKGCNPEQLKSVDALLSDAIFYRLLEGWMRYCNIIGENTSEILSELPYTSPLRETLINSTIFENRIFNQAKKFFQYFLIENTAMKKCAFLPIVEKMKIQLYTLSKLNTRDNTNGAFRE